VAYTILESMKITDLRWPWRSVRAIVANR